MSWTSERHTSRVDDMRAGQLFFVSAVAVAVATPVCAADPTRCLTVNDLLISSIGSKVQQL